MAIEVNHTYLLWFVAVACCCGLTVLQVLTTPLDDFIPRQPRVDNSTFANVDELFTFHFHMDVGVSFDTKSLFGSVTHDMMTVSMTDKVVLDIWDMDIISVEYMPANSAQAFRDGQNPEPLTQLAFRTYTDLNPTIGHQLAI